jgi:hypothetical protein
MTLADASSASLQFGAAQFQQGDDPKTDPLTFRRRSAKMIPRASQS